MSYICVILDVSFDGGTQAENFVKRGAEGGMWALDGGTNRWLKKTA